MKCPACTCELQPLAVGGMTLDVCVAGCAGIWFDQFELKKFDEEAEEAQELLQLSPVVPAALDQEAKRPCPKCLTLIMMKGFSSVRRAVRLDTCPGCGGQWLDHGELAALRSEFVTDADRRQAASDFADQTLPRAAIATTPSVRRGFLSQLVGTLRP